MSFHSHSFWMVGCALIALFIAAFPTLATTVAVAIAITIDFWVLSHLPSSQAYSSFCRGNTNLLWPNIAVPKWNKRNRDTNIERVIAPAYEQHWSQNVWVFFLLLFSKFLFGNKIWHFFSSSFSLLYYIWTCISYDHIFVQKKPCYIHTPHILFTWCFLREKKALSFWAHTFIISCYENVETMYFTIYWNKHTTLATCLTTTTTVNAIAIISNSNISANQQ